MKRRIEIIREHWTRVHFAQSGPAVCPHCLRPLNLASVESVGLPGLPGPLLEAALGQRGLPVWEVPPAGRMACAGCVRDLLNGSGA
jgi:hypothetical protein